MVDRTLEFLDWLWRLCVDGLHPGSNYQRLKTCLDWMEAILDSLTHIPGKHQRKGLTPPSVGRLLEVAKQRGLLSLTSDDVIRSLLSCLLHGTDDIRENAGEILFTYMPWPLRIQTFPLVDGPSGNHGNAAETQDCDLLAAALDLCCSPKAYESEAGALLVKLIFARMVLEAGRAYRIVTNEAGRHTVVAISERLGVDRSDTHAQETECPTESDPTLTHSQSALQFLTQLVYLLKESCSLAESDLQLAATTNPGHGLVVSIQRCLTECRITFQPTEVRYRVDLTRRTFTVTDRPRETGVVCIGKEDQSDWNEHLLPST